MPETACAYSLADPKVEQVLNRLYDNVKKEGFQRMMLGVRLITSRILGRTWTLDEYVRYAKDLYVPLSRERGTFAYFIARAPSKPNGLLNSAHPSAFQPFIWRLPLRTMAAGW